MQKLLKNDKLFNIVVPIFSAILGMLVGAIIMLIGGYDPAAGFSALFQGMFGSPKNIGEMIRAASPLILAGLAVGFAFKTGLFNIGVEGQLLVGWLASVYVGYALNLPAVIHIPVAILAAAIAGGLWGMIPGFLKAKFKVHEVIVTIMLNYVALYTTADIIKRYLYAGNEKSYKIQESASLSSGFLSDLTNGSRLHWGILAAVLMAIIMWFLLEKTTTGYELKAVGYNRHASQYAGMNVSKNIVFSMTISGAFAGIAGAMEGLGTFQNMTVLSAFTGTGFDGIAVALLGANNPFGIIIAGVLFGGLNTAAPQMNFNANVPSELVEIIIALIIFFVASSYLIRLLLTRFSKEGK
ncbi:ABC transporter permease [Robertmurraya siralis]|uniref:ABC transporter permease n=1 Tax=Robertmurraya siralis TaxID=77777 RepID=A0A919WH38_9BACI|nr:ABC transporter permease [Robertmurraya siralis]PAE21450.1 branched-chain amino acid ABC transporter permease [Bacillus sp. 7504-2]GIN61591.1 ABC transporter permease [Robertmurraya siralis]